MDCLILIFAGLMVHGATPSALMPEPFQDTLDNSDDTCICTSVSECTQIPENYVNADVIRNLRTCPGENMVCCPFKEALDVSTDAYNKMCQEENSKQPFPDPRCCGRHVYNSSAEPKDTDRIYNGQNSPPEQHPWLVRIYTLKNRKSECSGVLIGARHVLTADHCVYGINHPGKKIREIGLGCGERCEQRIKFKIPNRMPVHTNTRLRPDIAILMLDEPAQFTNIIRPICLPHATDVSAKYETLPEASEYAVAGWGETENGDTKGKKHALVQHMPNDKCEPLMRDMCENNVNTTKSICDVAKHMYGYSLKGKLICSGSENGSTCVGDSGGPLMQRFQENKNSRYEVAGVIKAYLIGKKKCSEGEMPNINFDIVQHIEWIKKTVRKQIFKATASRAKHRALGYSI